MLDKNGLAQLTKDDTHIEDAFENLINDGALTNVLSADGKFEIHYKTMLINEPALIFAATDGCFGYIQSPMEFEYIILKSMMESGTPKMFKSQLCKELSNYAGDDLALGMMSFCFGDFLILRCGVAKNYTTWNKEKLPKA